MELYQEVSMLDGSTTVIKKEHDEAMRGATMPEKCNDCKYAKSETYANHDKPTFTCLFQLMEKDDGRKCAKDEKLS